MPGVARRSIDARRRAAGEIVSTEKISAAMREAIAAGEPLRISGAGTWMNAGRPVLAQRTISLAADKGVIDYVPDDLTITVRAGTALDEIAAVTREHGQLLPLDPPGARSATIGATIATASSGPLAHSCGFARDFILGLELVTGKGDVIRSGGRVVKNVAGFDLMRLNCGAWGTLGIITQATFRLYAIPKIDRTFALQVPSGINATPPFLESLRNAPLSALAMEGIHPAVASQLGLPPAYTVLVRLGGNAKLIDAQLATLGKIGKPAEVDGNCWRKLSELDLGHADAAIRLSGLPSNISQLWQTAHGLLDASESGSLHSTFSRGIVRLTLRGLGRDARLPATSTSQRIAYETLPPEMWQRVSPSVIADRLSQSVRAAYDPDGLLNPGILG
jgi:glycolate oxidase FAD binding subunit